MASSLKCSASKSNAERNGEINADCENRLLSKLKVYWTEHQQHGIETRHMMGAFINAELGSPAKTRQAHGGRVLKKAATKLGLSESELSRMRWLAELFKEPDQLLKRHPQCTSWTKFKALLPSLKREDLGEAASEPLKRSRSSCVGISHSVTKLRKLLETAITSDGEVSIALRSDLESLVKVAQAILNKTSGGTPADNSAETAELFAA